MFLHILKIIVGGFLNLFSGMRRGFKHMYRTASSHTLIRGCFKFSKWLLISFVAVFIILVAWAFVSTAHLIMEGEFDWDAVEDIGNGGSNGDTSNGGDTGGGSDQIYSEYNDVTKIINKVDLNKMPIDEPWPADLDPKMYVRPEIKPKVLLEFYLLLAEICSDEGIKGLSSDGGLACAPRYLLGNWYHECAWSLSGDHIKSAWTAWSLYWTDGSPASNGMRASGLYGATGYYHGMTNLSANGGRGAMTGPDSIWQVASNTSQSYGYISRAENPDLKEGRVIHGTVATIGSTLGNKVKEKSHPVFPMSGIERPSPQFLPDASYTAAHGWAAWLGGKSVGFGSGDAKYAASQVNAAKAITNKHGSGLTDSANALMCAPIMIQRTAGYPYNGGLPGSSDEYGSLYGKFMTGLYLSGWLEKLSGPWLMQQFESGTSALMPGIAKTIAGVPNWGSSDWQKTQVFKDIEKLGKISLNGVTVDFSNMYTEMKNKVSGASGADNISAALFGPEVYIMGVHLERTIVELATQMSAKYPNTDKPGTGDTGEGTLGESVSVGDGVYDKNGDRICDFCKKSIYIKNPDCKGPDVKRPSPHPVQKKLIFPIAGDCYFSDPSDYHGADSNCSTHGASKHYAYDMTTGNLHPGIVSIADGEVIKCVNQTSGFGCHTIIAYPNSVNPQFTVTYAHMSRYTHKDLSGMVRAGTILGYMGSTGWSTGHHLHMEIWKGSKPIDYHQPNSGIVYMPNTGASECYTTVSSMNTGACEDLGCRWK